MPLIGGFTPEEWTPALVEDCLTICLPGRSARPATQIALASPVLEAFFLHLRDAGALGNAAELAGVAASLRERILAAANDTKEWSPSKKAAISAIAAGVDPDDDRALEAFLREYHPRPSAEPLWDDPCPCASGQSYRSCCGGPDRTPAWKWFDLQNHVKISDMFPEKQERTFGAWFLYEYANKYYRLYMLPTLLDPDFSDRELEKNTSLLADLATDGILDRALARWRQGLPSGNTSIADAGPGPAIDAGPDPASAAKGGGDDRRPPGDPGPAIDTGPDPASAAQGGGADRRPPDGPGPPSLEQALREGFRDQSKKKPFNPSERADFEVIVDLSVFLQGLVLDDMLEDCESCPYRCLDRPNEPCSLFETGYIK